MLLGCTRPPPPAPDPSVVELTKNARSGCDAPNGIPFHGRRRYVHGVNYAWHEFGTDFGGHAAWGRLGVRGDAVRIDADFAAIASAGASVVRWWVFPELRSDGLVHDASGGVPRLSERALLDLDEALALAERHDLYLLLTLFSFDAFRAPIPSAPDRFDLAPVVRDAKRVEELGQRIVTPLVERAARGRHPHRVFAWDLMNEPEWAVADLGQRNMCEAEDPNRTDCVSYDQMHWFLTRLSEQVGRAIQGLPEHQKPLVTVGTASVWEHRNWEAVPQDFQQLHFYDADYERGALVRPSTQPTVIGEFPSWGLAPSFHGPSLDATQLLAEIQTRGFQGGLGWTYNHQDPHADWPALARGLRAMADANGCRLRY